jgi:hypothetical protein
MDTRVTVVIIGLSAITSLGPGTASAQVPKPEDTESCNEKARAELRTANASPRTESDRTPADRTDPGPERGGATASAPPAGRDADRTRPAAKGAASPKLRTGTPSAAMDDPQLEGIDPEGAKDPAYVAAYKTCMRQAGF